MHIVYRDRDVLVCYKEAGLPVQSRDVARKDLESELRTLLDRESPGRGAADLHLVHRLDQPVEGLLVFALRRGAAAALSAQAQNGQMKKIYLAAVSGKPETLPLPGDEGLLAGYIRKDAGTNMSAIVPKGTPGAKEAALSWRALLAGGPEKDRALLQIALHTGRHHQIRVQLSHAGMPILGDRKYGGQPLPGLSFPALCAWKLSFIHPSKKEEETFCLSDTDFWQMNAAWGFDGGFTRIVTER